MFYNDLHRFDDTEVAGDSEVAVMPMSNVTKKDIVDEIAARTGLTQVDTKIIVECFLDAISKSLQQGKNIEIRGFGRFKVKPKKARTARNPRTGDLVQVEAGIKPVFEASKELKFQLNSQENEMGESNSDETESGGSTPQQLNA